MNFSELQTELETIFIDPTLESSFPTWLNQSVRELAYQYDLPALRLKLPATLATTTSNWQYNISTATPPATGHTYMKFVFKMTNSAHPRGLRVHRDTQQIDLVDPDHDETGNDVRQVAVEDDTDDAVVSIFPKANDTLNLWWYRNPIDMSSNTDVPDGIPAAFHLRVLIPKTVLYAFRVYPNLNVASDGDNTRSLTWWTNKLLEGLHGSRVETGMIDALKKSSPPRVRGAATGSNLAGSDRFRVRHAWR